MDNGTKLRVGDRIRLEGNYGIRKDFAVEEFRQCLGVFWSYDSRKAGNFTPLCEMYGPGPETEHSYISNYGEYQTNQVPVWMNLPRLDGEPEAVNSHQSLVSALEGLLEKVDWENPGSVFEADSGCIECTSGTTPDRWNTGPCAYHRARAALKAAKGETA